MVSIHALLAECDSRYLLTALRHDLFQSTHSLRSATIHIYLRMYNKSCFNPRTPCGVRQKSKILLQFCKMFQSTHSLRSATAVEEAVAALLKVSIHALLAECDKRRPLLIAEKYSFNPRTPCGVRRPPIGLYNSLRLFQSTHSLRSATCLAEPPIQRLMVSIHALLAECDDQMSSSLDFSESFNPRTPCGVRLAYGNSSAGLCMFQSTHSLRSATCLRFHMHLGLDVSIHALLAECDKLSPLIPLMR